MRDGYACGACGKLRLREGVDLRPGEAVEVPRIRVRRDVEAVRVGADMRIVAQIGPGVGTPSVRAVVRNVDVVNVPGTGRVRRRADRDVEVIHAREHTLTRAGDLRIQRQNDHEEPLRGRVVEAARVGYERSANAGRTIDRRRVAVERVQIDGVVHVPWKAGHDVGGGVVGQH